MLFLLRLLACYALRFLSLGVDPTYSFGVEFVTGSFTDITSKLERGSWGSTIVDLFHDPQPGHAMFEFQNDDGMFTPRNNPNLKPGRAIKFTGTHGGSTYPLFFGRLTNISASPRMGARTTILEAVDDWERVARLTYSTSLFISTPVQSLFCTLMSLSSVRSFSADATIMDTIGFAWYRDRDAPNALKELVRSGNYAMQVDGNGTYYLRDRYWSLFATGVNTYTYADDVRTTLSEESVINQTKMTANPRQLTTDIATLAFVPGVITIPASTAVGFWLSYQDPNEPSADIPVTSLVTPISSTDFYGSSNADGTGTDLTSAIQLSFRPFAASAVCSLFNGGGTDLYLQRFQIRGFPVKRLPPFSTQYDIASSQSVFGVRNVTIDNQLIQNYAFMDALSKTITAERKDGRDEMKFSLTNEFPDVLAEAPGGLLSFVDSFSGYTAIWRIRGVQHEISFNNGLRHNSQLDLEAYDQQPFLVLDDPVMGKLDSGRVLAI